MPLEYILAADHDRPVTGPDCNSAHGRGHQVRKVLEGILVLERMERRAVGKHEFAIDKARGKGHAVCLTALPAVCLREQFVCIDRAYLLYALALLPDRGGILRAHKRTPTQSAIWSGDAVPVLPRRGISSLRVRTAAGCIIRKRSIPARRRVMALIVSQTGPRSSREPKTGGIFIQASRAAQALVAAEITGWASSLSPISAAYRARS